MKEKVEQLNDSVIQAVNEPVSPEEKQLYSDLVKPSLKFSSPVNHSSFSIGSNISLEINFDQPTGQKISHIEFQRNNSLLVDEKGNALRFDLT